MSNAFIKHQSSFRDPSGFVFEKEGVLYRQVNLIFKESFDHFISSGCYTALVAKGLLIPHQEIEGNLTGSPDYYKTLQPESLPFISYPYEWSFDMLKDASLLTLQMLKEAIHYGLILKDATPFNIQWYQGKLIFIDTLSFEKYNKEEPWVAYRQFCECFLSPLLLMHYAKTSLQELQLAYPKGIPLAVTKSLLPFKSRLSLHIYLHIHLHARVSSRKTNEAKSAAKFSKQKMLNLITSLETLIMKLQAPHLQTTWSDYYDEAAQRMTYLENKKEIIRKWVNNLTGVKTAADLGANDGVFSKLLSAQSIYVLATDFDPLCINNLYKEIKKNKELLIQPFVLDLSNPSPSIGVNNNERVSFLQRAKVDLVLALAVIHHLAIGENMGFEKCAELFSHTGHHLIIEFVPKEDDKIQLMLYQRKDIYSFYTPANFEAAFSQYFRIKEKQAIPDSLRTLYLFEKI